MIYLLIKQRVDYDDYPISEIILHAFTSEEKLNQYKIERGLVNDLPNDSNRTIYVTITVDLD